MSITDIDSLQWHEDALCKEYDPSLWFPPNGFSSRDGIKICTECPVLQNCFKWALRLDADFGTMPGTYAALPTKKRRRYRMCKLHSCYEVTDKHHGSSYWFCSEDHRLTYMLDETNNLYHIKEYFNGKAAQPHEEDEQRSDDRSEEESDVFSVEDPEL